MFDYFLTHATNCQKIENKPPCLKHLIALVWLVLGQVHYDLKKGQMAMQISWISPQLIYKSEFSNS